MKLAFGLGAGLGLALVTFFVLIRVIPPAAAAAAPAAVSRPTPDEVLESASTEILAQLRDLRNTTSEADRARALDNENAALRAQVAALEAESSARERQWNRFFDSANDVMRRHRLPLFERMEKQTGAAVNDGLYGEGRPAPGAYGESSVTAGTLPVHTKW